MFLPGEEEKTHKSRSRSAKLIAAFDDDRRLLCFLWKTGRITVVLNQKKTIRDVHQEIGWNICFGDQIIWDHMLCCIVGGVLGCAIYDCVMLFQTVEICSEGRIILFNALQLLRYLVTILPYISLVILADGVGKNGSTVAVGALHKFIGPLAAAMVELFGLENSSVVGAEFNYNCRSNSSVLVLVLAIGTCALRNQ
uniref:Uncharacterized protein n=1 Tax=Glossina palpalis gambiensis TaxID=67801 RepID=A0A1B0C0L3_9MUSC